ncbi:MAG: SUMF1/EgtB/PvdO family nonheme iron enzyme [Anaerolineae bacterium]|jgi:formylglycine-generating enzyme required for sulfatase activity|nr:SUMF1/EgtB/PvdO family nonheme iron enzyme [Anaerolineae bacterium]
MKLCPQCKTELPDEARFCLKCGAAQTGAATSAAARDSAVAVGAGATALGTQGTLIEGSVNGDFLGPGAQKIINPDSAQAAAERARERYLRRVQQQCNVLPLAAMGADEGVGEELSLEQVYVALDTTSTKTLTDAEREELRRRGGVGRWEREDTLTALDAATQTQKLALLGDPGGGKSTFVRQLAAQTAAAALSGKAPFPNWETGLVPVLIILRELAPRLAAVELKGLADADQEARLREVIREHLTTALSECKAGEWDTCLEDELLSGNLLLILDGLDEVPEHTRGRVRRAVGALLQAYGKLKRVIVTCRVRSYSGAAVLPGFTPHTLAAFNENKIRAFVQGWYQAQEQLGRVTAAVAAERSRDLQRAALSGDLRTLAGNPMLLTTMALIHQKEVGLPKERVCLYSLIVQVLFTRWQQRKGLVVSPELTAVLSDDLKLRALLERLAYEAHSRQAGKRRGGDLARKDLLEILEDKAYLGNLSLAAEFLDYVDQRAGLLVGQGGAGDAQAPKTYAFPHRTFQEYLAGCYLVSGRSAEREYWQLAAQPEAWALAAPLGAEELYYNRRNTEKVLDLAYALAPEQEPNARREWQALLWSAQMATVLGAEVIRQDTARPDGGPAYMKRLLQRLAQSVAQCPLSALGRAELGNALAKLGDPRPGVGLSGVSLRVEAGSEVQLPDIVWCEVPAGPFLMGSDKARDGAAFDDEQPQHEVILPLYCISRYPVTVAQFDAFVQAGGYAEARYWPEALAAGVWQQGQIIEDLSGNELRRAPVDYGAPFNLPNHPVVGITWYEALAFCRWLEESLQGAGSEVQLWKAKRLTSMSLLPSALKVQLPSEAEWEKAARGGLEIPWGEAGMQRENPDPARRYPWGHKPEPEQANYDDTGIETTSTVGCFPEGASPYGVEDLSGNVWEWTRSHKWDYPYNSDDGRENLDAHAAMRRVLRGGAFDNQPKDVRCTYRISNTPSSSGKVMGFRVVCSSGTETSGADNAQDKKLRVFYSFAILPLTKSAHVGGPVNLTAKLIPTTESQGGFELPSHVIGCYCFLSTDGLQIQNSDSAMIHFDPGIGQFTSATFSLQAHLCGDRPYTIELFAEDPVSGRISIYKTGGIITVHPPEIIEEQPPLLPPLDIRVAPQPDFVLNVTTTLPSSTDEMRHLTYYLSSRVPGLRLHNQRVGAVTLRAADYARIQTALQATLRQVAGMQARDARERLLMLGKSLFDLCFPPESTHEFRQALQQSAGQATTWLIRQDEYIWVPWELLVPYSANENAPLHFLGERYHLSRWVEGLGPPLYSEVPLGEIALAHYKILEAGTEEQDEGLRAWRQLLHAPGVYGILPVVNPETPFYSVHVLYHAGSWLSKRDIIARDSATAPASPEQDAAKARLHLRLKRPVVTLGMWDDKTMPSGTNAEAWQLPERVLPFLRAGASAVIGPWWPTSEAADRIFWPAFYDLLERRVPLGESVWRARLAVRQALPERPDWLAYALFGDPRARAYWPDPSEGYTVLECLNPDDPLRPGKTYTFRVSLRNRPPIAYTDRLVQPEALPETLRALFLVPGLQTVIAEPIEMTPLGRTMLQATVDLTPPAPGDYPLLVQLLEGDEHIKTMQLTLKVRAETIVEGYNG